MFVDTEIAGAARRPSHAKQVEYLLVAALVAVTVCLFFVMGFFSHASAETIMGTHHNYVQLHTMGAVKAGLVAEPVAAAPMAWAASVIADARHQVSLSEMAPPADQHILIGLMLLATAVMAAVAFSFLRWQMRGPMMEAQSYGR